MLRAAAIAALLAPASAFQAGSPVLGSRGQAVVSRGNTLRPSLIRMEEEAPAEEAVEEAAAPEPEPEPVVPAGPKMSEAMPFLVYPATLEGTDFAGDAGFDPVGFTKVFSPMWLREAEIKHGRVTMLAIVGLVFTDFYTLPQFTGVSGLAAHDAGVASGAMSQILTWGGFFEVFGLIAIMQMMNGSGRVPGDFGLDPMGMLKGPKADFMKEAEVKNGRLAMLAFSGAITQSVLSGNGFPFLYTM